MAATHVTKGDADSSVCTGLHWHLRQMPPGQGLNDGRTAGASFVPELPSRRARQRRPQPNVACMSKEIVMNTSVASVVAQIAEEPSSESQWASFDVGPDGPKLPNGRLLDLPGRGQLFVRDTGARRGVATVVLLHGWGATVDLNFFRTYSDLANQYRVVAFDMRGHGRGLRPRAFFRLEDCADDVIAVADALGIAQVIPVGYSMGGVVAQLVAHRHPKRVAGLVLCATSKKFRSTGRERKLWDTSMSLAAAALTLTPAGLRTNLLGKFLLVRREPGTPKWMLDELGRTDPALVVQAGLAIGRYDASAWIGELGIDGSSGIPASVVIMQHDQTISTPRQRKLAAALSGATSFEVDADHRAAVNNPELFNPALLAALASVTGKR
jgi:3-oxoadipate enol-lactonase